MRIGLPVSEERPRRVSRLNLLPDNDNDAKNGSKRPTMPGRGRPGPLGSGKRRPRIPPWVIALLFLGLVAYQLYAIFDPQRDSQSLAVPYSVVEQQVRAKNVSEVVLTDTS